MKKEMLIAMLVDKGWFYQEDFLDSKFCLELLNEARDLKWKQAQIGKGDKLQEALSIRNDSISWIEDEQATKAQKNYLVEMNDLMATLNQELYLGLKEFECHFAHYQASGFYKKHLDQHSGSNARVVSSILYLNETTKGGELAIYNRDNPEVIEQLIKPRPGSFVCFLSNQIYHEVLPTESERFSLTGWFRNSIQ
jgi:SM-20-related protein